jgi:MarR family transcriptional regulator, organic hydroperoxide resistance regulator
MQHVFIDKELVFGLMSGRASTAINRKIYRSFSANSVPLTPEQWMVLQYLSLKDGISQRELAEMAFRDKTGITRMLDILQRNGLIARLSDKIDKRCNRIFLTKSGQVIHQNAKQFVFEAMQSAVEGLSEEEVRIGEKILRKVFDNLE